MTLTDTQRAILAAAARHPEHLAYPPARLPAGARQTVAKALLKNDLVVAVHRAAYDAVAKWTVDGDEMLLQITAAGLRAIGQDPEDSTAADDALQHRRAAQEAEEPIPPCDSEEERAMQRAAILEAEIAAEEAAAPRTDTAPTGGGNTAGADVPAAAPEPAHTAPTPAPRASLRDAAAAVLAAWDGDTEEARLGLPEAISALRAALAGKPPRAARGRAAERTDGAPRKPREGTKQAQVLALLRREEGASVAQICEATGWQPHTVRGFFAGLKKRQGIEVKVLERIRMVGPNREGARGSHTIYRIAE
jgi:hypothetical protein